MPRSAARRARGPCHRASSDRQDRSPSPESASGPTQPGLCLSEPGLKRREAPVACPPWIHVNRNRVERLWARLKEWRAVATRYEKTARSFMGVLCMAATMDWIK